MDEEGDLAAGMLLIIYLLLGLLALKIYTLAALFWRICYHQRQEQEGEELQEFKLAKEDAEDIIVASSAAAGEVLESPSSCVVCLDEFKEGDLCQRLQCGHIFHRRCIQTWLNKGRSKTCPLCRMEFLPQEEDDEEEDPYAFSHA